MRLGDRGKGTDDGRRIRVDEGQRRDRIVGAPGPAAATGNVHSERLSCGIVMGRRTRAAAGATISNRYPSSRGRGESAAITSRPGNARTAPTAIGAGLAKPGRAVRHGGAGGLRT